MDRDKAIRYMHDLLRMMVQKDGSDLFITANFPPAIKVDGRVKPVTDQPLTPQQSASLVRSSRSYAPARLFIADNVRG